MFALSNNHYYQCFSPCELKQGLQTLILLLLPADDADDVTQITTTLSFMSETNVDCILFNITKDDVVESPETFTVAVGRSFSTILVLDNDGTGMYER